MDCLRGASQIAAMLSADDGDTVSMLSLDIDDIPGAIEDSKCIETDEATITTSTKKKKHHKSKADLIKAVELKKQAIHRAFKMMRNAEEVDLCFLVDCTGSMGSYITRVKNTIKTWFERLRGNYKHLKLRVSFIRYTDFDQPKSTRTTWLDFTEDIKQFYSFVDAIGALGGVGGDDCEDVFGGLEAVTKLAWREIGTKVLIHFADAPCHGNQYHDRTVSDNHPEGDPDHRDLNEIMNKLYRCEIYYYFGYINKKSTERMVQQFDKVLLERGGREMTIQTFDAEHPHLIDEAVYRSISSSISASLEKLTVGKPRGKIRDFEIMPAIPEWEKVETRSVKVSEATGTAVAKPTISKQVKLAKQPFAKGGIRLAYHAYIIEERRQVVIKEFLATAEDQTCLKRFMESSIIQSTAASFATEFNREKAKTRIELEFASCGIMEDSASGERRYYSYEPYIDGDYTKFNSNAGYVSTTADPVNDACQAFSHYTWVKSDKALVVCDIQGVKKGTKLLLTDPAIHCKNVLKFGSTNLGVKGIKKFFESHKCNEICIAMRLENSPYQRT